MIVLHALLLSSESLFTGVSEPKSCYGINGSQNLSTAQTDGSLNMSESFREVTALGLAVHVIGVIADATFVVRVRSTNYYFRAYSLAAVSCYGVLWLLWLGWLHVARYTKPGLVCSGYYLK